MDFQEIDTAQTLEVQEVSVEEEDVAMATLVEGKKDNLGVEVTFFHIRCEGYNTHTFPNKRAKDFRGGKKLVRHG